MQGSSTTEHLVLQGEAIEVLRREPSHSFDAVYLDPPFFTQSTQRGRSRTDGRVRVFEDRWADSASYISWVSDLLKEVHRVLRPTGAVMVHCDWRASHHIRVALDQVFGIDNFRNEIIWSYRRWTAARNAMQRLHQTIYYYAASPKHQMAVPTVEYSPTTNLDQIWHARTRNENGVAEYLRKDGLAVSSGAKKGVPLGDVWEIPYLNPKAKERTGYPTQKPLELLERLLAIAVPPGGRVLDPCCGSGTTLVAAQALGYDSLGIDISEDAVELAMTRLADPVRTVSRVLTQGRDSYRRNVKEAASTALALLKSHAVQRNRLISGVLSPDGLRQLGLPTGHAVAISLEPSALEAPASVAAMALKKQYELVILFGEPASIDLFSNPQDASHLGWKAPRVLYAGPAPSTEDGVRELALTLPVLLEEAGPADMRIVEF